MWKFLGVCVFLVCVGAVKVVPVGEDDIQSRVGGRNSRPMVVVARTSASMAEAVEFHVLSALGGMEGVDVGRTFLWESPWAFELLDIPRGMRQNDVENDALVSGRSAWVRLIHGGVVYRLEGDDAAALASREGGEETDVEAIRAFVSRYVGVVSGSGATLLTLSELEGFSRRGGRMGESRGSSESRKGRAASAVAGREAGAGQKRRTLAVVVLDGRSGKGGRALEVVDGVWKAFQHEADVDVSVVDVHREVEREDEVVAHWRVVLFGEGVLEESVKSVRGQLEVPGRRLDLASTHLSAFLESGTQQDKLNAIESAVTAINDAAGTHRTVDGSHTTLAGRSRAVDAIVAGWYWLPEESMSAELERVRESVSRLPPHDRKIAKPYITAMDAAVRSGTPQEFLRNERDRLERAVEREQPHGRAGPLERRLNVLRAILSDDRRAQLREWDEFHARKRQRDEL